jgi:hypothetical protein
MCFPLLWVVAIDGDRINPPTTKAEIEALIQRVEEDGFVAIQEGRAQHFPVVAQQSVESAKN